MNIPTPDWLDDAACADLEPEAWFAFGHDKARRFDPYFDARQVCNRCPVRRECLTAALERGEEHGLWGGLDPEQRQRLTAVAS